MVSRILDPQRTFRILENICVDAAESVVGGLDTAFSQKIASQEYDWPRQTKRSNGQVVGSPRDIIDTGELDGSQRLNRENRYVWRWDWTAAHALLVHEGFTLRSGGEYPGRPWTKRAVAEYKPGEKFVQEVRSRV